MSRRAGRGERRRAERDDETLSVEASSDEDAGDEEQPRHRFWVPQPPSGDTLNITGDLAHRLGRVLRLQPGAVIELFDGSGRRWQGRIMSVTARDVTVTVEGTLSTEPAPPETVILPALIRPQRFDWLLEKATELGATAIAPVVTERSVVRAQAGGGRLDRWQRIVVEAAEQCGRATIPVLSPPEPLLPALRSRALPLLIAAEPAHGEAPPLGEVVRTLGSGPVAVLTGPEGGFTVGEVSAAVAEGARPFSLGPRILRAETAAIAALAVIVDQREAAVRNVTRD